MTDRGCHRGVAGGIALLLAFLLSACSAGADSAPTPAYEFITPTPPPINGSAWDGVTLRTLCVDVSWSSVGDYDAQLDESSTTNAGLILSLIGISASAGSGSDCEATLSFNVEGEALSGEYSPDGSSSTGRTCFTGARVTGTAVLSGQGYQSPTLPADGVQWPRGAISEGQCPSRPSAATYMQAWREAMLRVMAGLWGRVVPAAALLDPDLYYNPWAIQAAVSDLDAGTPGTTLAGLLTEPISLSDDVLDQQVRFNAIIALQMLGREAVEEQVVVPALIDAMDAAIDVEGSPYGAGELASSAQVALEEFTGQSFGNDPAAWRRWWERQP